MDHMAQETLQEIVEFEVDIRQDLDKHFDSDWPAFKEKSLLESAVIEASHKLQVSKQMALNCALGAISTACQGRTQVKQPTGNIVNTNLMLLTIAESGERKTTVEKQFFKSIRKLQAEENEDYYHNSIVFRRDQAIWFSKVSTATHELEDVTEEFNDDPKNEELKAERNRILEELKYLEDNEPLPKVSARVIYDDTTPQALVRMMHSYYRHACLLSSEANGIFNGRAFQDLHLLNSLWDGMDIHVDRTTQSSFVLSNARLTLALMTQMQVIETFLNKRGEEARGLGFLARFLVVRPPHLAGKRNAQIPLENLESIEAFNQRTLECLKADIEHQNKGKTQEVRDEKIILTFTAKAKQAWHCYAQAIEDAQQTGEVYEFYRDHASKLMDNITRIAGLVHYFHHFNEPENTAIDQDTLDYAYQLGMRYSKHFLMYIAGEPALIKQAKALILYLFQPPSTSEKIPDSWNAQVSDRYNQYKDWNIPGCQIIAGAHYRRGRVVKFTAREIRQYGPPLIRDPQKLFRVVGLLKQMGFIKDQAQGRKTHWEFHEASVFNATPFKECDALDKIRFKNGHEYTIDLLPKFEEWVAIQNWKLENSEVLTQLPQSHSYLALDKDAYRVLIRCRNIEKDMPRDHNTSI